MKNTLSIVMPFYNERATITAALDMVRDAPLTLEKELLVVNDGSTDGSEVLARQWIADNHDKIRATLLDCPHRGKGAAVRAGIAHSHGAVLIIQDADCEYNPCDFQKCVDPIAAGETRVVYGSRERYTLNRKTSSWGFYLGGLSVTLWFNILYGTSMTDEPTCYKTFDGELIRNLEFSDDRFGWEPEVTAKLLKLGFEIREVPVEYHPRKLTEGKKIKFRDGLAALWLAFYWRFRSVAPERKRLATLAALQPTVGRKHDFTVKLGWIFVMALLLRTLLALPGLAAPEMLLRPDSAGYLYFAEGFDFGCRAPLMVGIYGVLAQISGHVLLAGGLFGIVAGALAVYPAALTGRLLGGNAAGLWAALALALNLTAIGNAPLLLSDSVFMLLTGFQVFFLARLWKRRRLIDFGWMLIFATAATLCRGMNLPWLLAGAPVLGVIFLRPGWKMLAAVAGTALVFTLGVVPFMALNQRKGAGFTLEYNAANGFIHNASAVIAHAEKRNSATVLTQLYAEMDQLPGSTAEKNRLRLEKFLETIKKYPMSFVVTHLPQPYMMLPDLPSVSENLGLSREGRGTLAVIRQHGLAAGVKHYFRDGSGVIVLLLSPFLLLTFAVYLAAGLELLRALRRRDWGLWLVFLAGGFYYLALPGPVIMPRYQLPALIIIVALAGTALARWWPRCRAAAPEAAARLLGEAGSKRD